MAVGVRGYSMVQRRRARTCSMKSSRGEKRSQRVEPGGTSGSGAMAFLASWASRAILVASRPGSIFDGEGSDPSYIGTSEEDVREQLIRQVEIIPLEVVVRNVAAAVIEIAHGDRFDAWLGGGARRDGTRLAPVAATPLPLALVATGFGYDPERRRRQAAVAL